MIAARVARRRSMAAMKAGFVALVVVVAALVACAVLAMIPIAAWRVRVLRARIAAVESTARLGPA